MNQQEARAALGVGPGATVEQIRQAYRRSAMAHHPDRNPGDSEAEARFKRAKQAYERLSEASAAPGDEDGSSGSGFHFDFGHSFDGDSLGDLFGAIFGRQERDSVEVRLTWQEALSGCVRELDAAPWGRSGTLGLQLPPLRDSEATVAVEAHGRQRRVRIRVDLPEGWILESGLLSRALPLTILDQLLGVESHELTLPDGVVVRVAIPPDQRQGTVLVLDHVSLRPWRVALRFDFSKAMMLNDTERNHLRRARASLLKREKKNGQ